MSVQPPHGLKAAPIPPTRHTGRRAETTDAPSETACLAVVLVNWNHFSDTIECLESLLHAHTRARIIVVDNASEDRSIEHFRAWATGEVPYAPPAGPLGRLTTPAVAKPLPFKIVSSEEAEKSRLGPEKVTFIAVPENRGFAAGSNLGMRHALRDPAILYLWCLNNDTVVEPDAITALLARLNATHRLGMCGTQIRYYHRPGHWQALNGQRFNLFTGQSQAIGRNIPVTRPFNPKQVAQDTDFVVGASLAVSRTFIDTVGFMDESYFLYFEEMDWSVRNRRRFATTFAHAAVVYHKEGGSIGSSARKGQRSALSEYYLTRSRLKFYRRNFPLLLPFQYPLGLALIFRRLWRRQPRKAAAIFRALVGLGYRAGPSEQTP